LAAVGNIADATTRARYPNFPPTIAARDGFLYTAPVGRFKPNAWGLLDMHGNVWEWCADGPDGSPCRMTRGGGWEASPGFARSANHGYWVPEFRGPSLGFRLALDPPNRLPREDGTEKNDRARSRAGTSSSTVSSPMVISSPMGLRLALIPAGEFWMGPSKEDQAALENEKPRHRVKISHPFYLGIHEVTQAEFEMVMGKNPSSFSMMGAGKDRVAGMSTRELPVENVSWFDAVEFCNRLSLREKLQPCYRIEGRQVSLKGTGGYRLPTEAEWEYACRAGGQGAYCFGNDTSLLARYAWFGKDENWGATSPVMASEREGQRLPNAFGLWDMHGNVWEWCEDWYWGRYALPKDGSSAELPVVDPHGPEQLDSTDSRVIRGGSWWTNYKFTRRDYLGWQRSAYRAAKPPWDHDYAIGFRVARSGETNAAAAAPPQP
jgi:formylglycine-generating enzyme required for sulfatase activity